MSNIEHKKLLIKLADRIKNAKTSEEALEIIEKVRTQNLSDNYFLSSKENLEYTEDNDQCSAAIDFSTLTEYKNYFEAWLNIPIEQINKVKGVFVSSSDNRRLKPYGWLTYMPVCAFETVDTFLISCVPEWQKELKDMLAEVSVSEAVSRLNGFIEKRKNDSFVECYHKIYCLTGFNTQINTSSAVLLDYSHYDQYCEFRKKNYPSIYELIEPESILTQDYQKMVDEKIHYCVIINNEIVSLTESEDIENKPERIINIGINTLKEYRRNGYASIACAAFIKNILERGSVPFWQCDFDNLISQALAEKLGFRHVGNAYSISTLSELWKK